MLNILGYYGVLMGIKHKHTQNLLLQFDADNYADLQEVTFKIPLAWPYAPSSLDYNRTNGEFEYEGEVYRLVKQKLQSDTLYLVCVRDFKSKAINQLLTDYVKTFTDKTDENNNSNSLLLKLFKDYMLAQVSLQSVNKGWSYTSTYGSQPEFFESIDIQLVFPPPQV
ncbi:MAG TPA: hypothetical protein PKC24_05665 [Cyclobacteriaceae bacterium]|nr:hypothetical protein [Cyclobacteriaceae bacterium]